MDEQRLENLHLAFKSLPDEVKDWLGSEEATAALDSMTAKYNLNDRQAQAISFLIFRLATQDIQPESFTAELKEATGLDLERVKKITKEMDEVIFQPISQPFGILGIDTKLLYYTAPAAPATPAAPAAPAASEARPVAAEPVSPISPAGDDQPFILHQESGSEPIGPISPIRPVSPINPPGSTTPPKVIIEKIVHYTNLYTPLSKPAARSQLKSKVPIPRSRWFV